MTTKGQKIRKGHRINLGCILSFNADGFEGEATVKNISTSGCRAESETNLAEGLEFQVLIHLPKTPKPIKVERAAVRWIKGDEFGLSFVLFLPSERAKLSAFLGTVK